MSGWIRVERKVFTDEFFAREPMSEREAWLWMLSSAAWEDTTHRVGGQVLPVPRGSFMATLREMQSVFGWRSDTKVRNFLKRLEAERMVERTTCGPRNAPKTHVTICKYDEYQSSERTKNAPKTHRERTEKRSKETKINNKQTSSVEEVAQTPAEILSEIASPEAAENFVAHRKEMRKPMTPRAARAMVTKLRGHPDPAAVLNESVAQGWQGVFPEKIKPQLQPINGGKDERASKSQQRIQAFIAGAVGAS